MSARRLAGTLLLVLSAATAEAQSLWREGVPGSLFADHRARMVNDIVTIVVVEQSSQSRSASTTTSKSTSRTAALNDFPGLALPTRNAKAAAMLKLDLAGDAEHEGKGAIERSDRLTAQIPARVVKVLDNGNLVIEGRRAVLVNDETQVATISGVVRPQDITGANTVLSSQLADAEVQIVGRGVLSEAQRPGILYRILDWLRLF
ncbi:MAG TPA: flagellar basal body L-ring protein FlgH [Terriglobales bacterium]|nr:flagellar basal body L-ring protein FlgH [Terriglobales bacterium]